MPDMLILGRGGVINTDEVVFVVPFRSVPVKKLLALLPPERVLNLTYGYPRESVVLLKNGMYLIASRSVGELVKALHVEANDDNPAPPWW